MVSQANGRVEARPQSYRPGYTLREVYRNRGFFQCARPPAIELMEDFLGENFEITRERGSGRVHIWYGYHSEFNAHIAIVQGDKSLKRVYVRYDGNDPETDLSELRRILTEDAKLVRIVSKESDEFEWPKKKD